MVKYFFPLDLVKTETLCFCRGSLSLCHSRELRHRGLRTFPLIEDKLKIFSM